MDHARSLDQSRGSSQRFLSDHSQRHKELPFPVRYAIVSIRIRNLTQCTRQQIFPRRLLATSDLIEPGLCVCSLCLAIPVFGYAFE